MVCDICATDGHNVKEYLVAMEKDSTGSVTDKLCMICDFCFSRMEMKPHYRKKSVIPRMKVGGIKNIYQHVRRSV